ncbi:hypothetical protein FDQ92_02945 [Desulfoglaeba alkanexedens ALDC]|uniref:Transposase IS200-like domain-containing protein n=1 Tax=Desulfoglaeba alkanexedens ALDC TaxID=980445 RepID=A0A4P8L081_9BACT|nr:hypothetical protein FDQ92_02945 [Desulfoglaeba alkanexedens ALDC]
MRLYAYVIMENHIHLIANSRDLSKAIQSFKCFTARRSWNFPGKPAGWNPWKSGRSSNPNGWRSSSGKRSWPTWKNPWK